MQRNFRIWSSFSCSGNRKPVLSFAEGSAIQNPKWLELLVIAFVLVVGGAVALAQQEKKLPRIGYLVIGSEAAQVSEAFLQGLRDLGYVEGKNVIIEYRGDPQRREDRLPELAADSPSQSGRDRCTEPPSGARCNECH